MKSSPRTAREASVVLACLAVFVVGHAPAAVAADLPGTATPAADPSAVVPSGTAPLEEVLVIGEQPGPGMWRVTRDGHELWILGTLEPLPKQLSWRAAATDAVIARSQEVIAPPGVDLHIGFFKGLGAIPTALRARRNPDGATLAQVLPPALYVRWVVLRDKYLGSAGAAERLRPLFAARELYVAALDRSGLASGKIAWKQVRESARTHHVPVRDVNLDITVPDPKGTLREFEQIPRDPDVACLARTIERLETDLGAMRQRANLWSRGDVVGLRSLPYPDERSACIDAVASVPALGAQLDRARDQLATLWLATVEAALPRNRTTLAVLPIRELLEPDGAIARLRATGYDVSEP